MSNRPTCKSLQKQLLELQHRMSEMSMKPNDDEEDFKDSDNDKKTFCGVCSAG